MKKHLFLAGVCGVAALAALLLLFGPAPAPALAAGTAEAFVVNQLTQDDYRWSPEPQISGDRIVWLGSDGHDEEVYTWTPTGGTVRLTNNTTSESSPQVSGDRVVWASYDGDIYTWTPAKGTVRLTRTAYFEASPDVSGDRVIWCGADIGNRRDLFTWTPSTGAVQVRTNTYVDGRPRVSGDRIAWIENAEAGTWIESGIYTWTPGEGVTRITEGLWGSERVDVSGDRLAWMSMGEGATSGDSEIFTWTPASGIVRVTSNTMQDVWPTVSGDRIAWQAGTGSGSNEIYVWKPGRSPARLTTNSYDDTWPVVSGDRVVWYRSRGSNDPTQVFSWTPAAGVRQVSSGRGGAAPRVAGDRIVYAGGDGTGVEVFTAVAYAVTVPKVTKIAPSTGPSAGGTRVVVTGSGFLGMTAASAVRFGGTNATRYTVDSPTRITAIAPGHSAGVVDVVVTAAGGSSDATGHADDFTYVSRYEQDDPRLVYTGIWKTSTDAAASKGSFRFADGQGSSVIVPFTGTRLSWVTKKSAVYGKAKVSLDGTVMATVDLFNGATLYQRSVWNTGSLDPGLHWVKIQWTGTQNTAAEGTNIGLDAVDLQGSLATTVLAEQGDSHVKYSGTWTTVKTSSASGSSFAYADSTGASATIDFTGISLNLIAKKSPVYGMAEVKLDDRPPVKVDLYSTGVSWRQTVWKSGFLAPGAHRVVVRWTGTKRAAATDYNISLDAMEVTGTLK